MKKLLSLFFLTVVLNVIPLDARHYVATDGRSWVTQIISHVWSDGPQPTKQKHSIEEFIRQLVRSAREKGNDGVVDFLEEAAGWGFAVDAAYYDENANGLAMLALTHFVVLNETSKDARQPIEKLAKALREMHSIISPNDAVTSSYNSKGTCFPGGDCFSFAPYVVFMLRIPSSLNREVHVDVVRRVSE
jgi:sugar/nucleoside kinase (ribokinase family)